MLSGRRVVVTGAGRGLCESKVHAIAAAGAEVVVAELVAERGEAVVDDLRAAGHTASYEPVDVADEASVAGLAERVLAAGDVWGLVNNAGLADAVGGRYFWELTVDEWDRILAVNTRGPWLVSRAFVPAMRGAGRGRIVNIASDAALYGSPRLSHYITSKGALIALSRAMAREVGDDGITVNTVAPGYVDTYLMREMPERILNKIIDKSPIHRLGTEQEVGHAVVFLVDENSAWTTGSTLTMNGGTQMN